MVKGKGRHVAVLGAGSWGSALSLILAKNGHSVMLWGRDSDHVASLNSERENRHYLSGFPFPDSIIVTDSLSKAVNDAWAVLFAVPCGAMRPVAQAVKGMLPESSLLISGAKGLEQETGKRMSEVLIEVIENARGRLTVLSGPNLAVEMARGVPTAAVAAAYEPEAAQKVQRIFSHQSHPTFRIYTGHDVVGVELGGAIKNVIAIGSGVCESLGYGDNARAAMLTRGLSEAIRLGEQQGAEARTFAGLSGVGDLIATGYSRLSRNYRVGIGLGQGLTLEQTLNDLGQVAEGVPTTRVLCELAHRSGVDMPLCRALYSLLFEGQPASDVIRSLMLRPLRHETDF